LHPLQTFAAGAERALAGTYFFFEGTPGFEGAAEALVRELGGRPVRIARADKALYHAAAVVACNYGVTLVAEAVAILEKAGVARETGLAALLPLLHGTLGNLATAGLPDALTGPISRGDAETVERNLAALRSRAPGLDELYRLLGRHTVPFARANGTLSAEAERRISALLEKGR